jgi:tryptophan synthase beta chain
MRADMKKKPAPLIVPSTLKPCTAKDLEPVFCGDLVRQELDDTTAYFPIPDEIRNFYRMFRPSPLIRAYFLEKALGTPAKIYYKFEGNNTSGSHKLNSAVAQAYYAKAQGLKGVTTETGAGQWGTALSMACAFFGLDCRVFMVKCSYEQKPFRREVMRTYGASVTPSPSMTTQIGEQINREHPGTTGSLGCAISEAVEAAVSNPGYRYVLGSVLNQVLLHQSIIGLEAHAAFKKIGEKPDIIIGCAGGGSNLGGLIAPFMGEKLRGENDYRMIAVEPASCPSLTRGRYAYDYCDTGRICPLAKMYTLGADFIPSASHAGGLRYHGMSPVLSELYDQGMMEARSVRQTDVFSAAQYFARTEGILPAPESSHAIRAAMDEAIKCRETGEAKTILFGLTGTGYFDMTAYQAFNDHLMGDYIPTDEELEASFAKLPKV